MEVWGVIGRAILDEEFHAQLFAAASQGRRFEELTQLRDLLRKQLRLNMSRWEIMVTHRILTERHIDVTLPAQPIGSAGTDPEVTAIRHGFTGPTPVFFDDFHLCAVVGLASMDSTFRTSLHTASDPDPAIGVQRLDELLRNPPQESPIFNLLSEQNLVNLNSFLRAEKMMELFERFHITRWVQPSVFPCNGGYTDTPGAIYRFFSQAGLVKLVINRPGMLPTLQEFEALEE